MNVSAGAQIAMRGTRFCDSAGRHVILRGVNFSGDSKMPLVPNGHTYLPTDFADHRAVSFVGRPAPLDELPAHLHRLHHWGFNCLRLLTTWEAVEHAGPGLLDHAYLDYFAQVCRIAGEFGFWVVIDFHQDAWSRMSGGSGAPGWTFEAVGLDFQRFHAADAAHLMQCRYDQHIGGHQPGYPPMSWSGNYRMPANAIMWTLFFGGRTFAPSCKVSGECAQDFLQRHYLGAMHAVADRVAGMPHVIGFDTLNEPGTGYIGRHMDMPMTRYRGEAWTPLDGLAVASGLAREVATLTLGGRATAGVSVKNAARQPIWLPGRECPFRQAGAWDLVEGQAVARNALHFVQADGRPVDHLNDHMAPFFHAVARVVRSVRKDWLLFAEIEPFEAYIGPGLPRHCPERTVSAPHWYDLAALATKRFDADAMPDLLDGGELRGRAAIERAYVHQLGRLQALGDKLPGGAPTLMGECGVPFDLNERLAYRRWAAGERDDGIWAAQTEALELMYNALDQLLLSSTQWNYTVGNRNDPMVGDGWNQEDLSIWSADQMQPAGDLNSGARALKGFCRPFVRAAQGVLLRQTFDLALGVFEADIDANRHIEQPTEIYVPQIQFPEGWSCQAEHAHVALTGQLLHVRATRSGLLRIRISRLDSRPGVASHEPVPTYLHNKGDSE